MNILKQRVIDDSEKSLNSLAWVYRAIISFSQCVAFLCDVNAIKALFVFSGGDLAKGLSSTRRVSLWGG